MKNIIYILAFALFLSSCNDDLRSDNPLEVTDGSIQFCVNAESAVQSRSGDNETSHKGNGAFSVDESAMQITTAQNESRGSLIDSIPQMNDFGVYAFETTAAFTETGSSILTFDNQYVAVTGTTAKNTVCTYAPTQFWSNDASRYLTFMAYSPYIAGGIDTAKGLQVQRTASDNNSLTIRYDAPDDEMQPDLMVADVVSKTNATQTARVEEKFSHTLASVGFTIRANNRKIYSIKLESVVKGGSMKVSQQSAAPYFEWTLDATKGDVPVKMRTDAGQTYFTTQIMKDTLNTDDGYLMMIPQDLSTAKIVVEFENDEGNTETTSFSLSGITNHKWVAGTKYMYNITLTPFYDIEATPVTFEYGGGILPYTVTSKVVLRDGTETFSPWLAKFVDENGNDVATPSWLTLQSLGAASGTTAPVDYNSTAQIGVLTNWAERDLNIRSNTEIVNGDLSATETANCYVVNAAGSYRFRANVMGNGVAAYPWYDYEGSKGTGMSTAINTTGATAELLWQDAPGLIKSVSLNGDYISFTTADKSSILQGNAVIAIKNAAGVIMWNWHIWVTDINLTTDAVATNYGTSSCTLLNRPLGYIQPKKVYQPRNVYIKFYQTNIFGKYMIVEFKQLAHDETSESEATTLYEFGRKDPFIQAKSIANGYRYAFDINNNAISVFKLAAPDGTNYAKSIMNPTDYYIGGGGWCALLNANEAVVDVWGTINDTKTIYDPCPAGYRVIAQKDISGLTNSYVKSATTKGVEFYADATKTSTFYLPFTKAIYGRNYSGVTGSITYGYNRKSSTYAYNTYVLYINSNGIYKINDGSQAQTHSKGVIPVKITTMGSN